MPVKTVDAKAMQVANQKVYLEMSSPICIYHWIERSRKSLWVKSSNEEDKKEKLSKQNKDN